MNDVANTCSGMNMKRSLLRISKTTCTKLVLVCVTIGFSFSGSPDTVDSNWPTVSWLLNYP